MAVFCPLFSVPAIFKKKRDSQAVLLQAFIIFAVWKTRDIQRGRAAPPEEPIYQWTAIPNPPQQSGDYGHYKHEIKAPAYSSGPIEVVEEAFYPSDYLL